MRWFIAAVALTVICAIFGTAGALVLGGASLKLPRTDRPVMSLNVKGSGPAVQLLLPRGRVWLGVSAPIRVGGN